MTRPELGWALQAVLQEKIINIIRGSERLQQGEVVQQRIRLLSEGI